MEGKKMKKLISIITAVLMLICFSTVSAHADRKTVERIMIGTGVAILGAAIFNEINNNSIPQYSKNTTWHNDHKSNRYNDRHRHKRHKRYYASKSNKFSKPIKQIKPIKQKGHWEIEKTWIAPVYETKWNPGHYNRKGDWINSRYEKFTIQKGYWDKNKVWIWH